MFDIFKTRRNEFIALSLIYFMAQGLLLVVSGRWWDSWVISNLSLQGLYDFSMELGRPSLIMTLGFAKLVPEWGYRWITFLMMYFCVFFAYMIIKNWLNISDENCFWICALYAAIPACDARIVLAVFPYIVGYFFFMAGLCYFSRVINQEKISLSERIRSYLLFVLGFTLHSTLCFYGIVLLMIVMKKGINRFLRYLDFLFLPFIFYVIKGILFPTYGGYANYNAVSFGAIYNAALLILSADFYVMESILSVVHSLNSNAIEYIFVFATATIIFLYVEKVRDIPPLRDPNKLTASFREDMLIFLVGIICLSVGIFPYVVIRQTYRIATVGLIGRDALLVPLGAAMLIYTLVSFFSCQSRIRKWCFLGYIFVSISFFNLCYLSYQEDWYRQLGFRQKLSLYKEDIEQAANIICLIPSKQIDAGTFYQLNGNADLIFGDQSKFFMRGFSDAKHLAEGGKIKYLQIFVETGRYYMSNYDRTYKRIDAVIQYSFNATFSEVVKMKYYEVIGSAYFDRWISDKSSMTVLLDGTDEYTAILNANGYVNLE